MSDEFPEVRYTDIDGVAIAYEVRGDGPIDLLVVPGTLTSLLASAVDPTLATRPAPRASPPCFALRHNFLHSRGPRGRQNKAGPEYACEHRKWSQRHEQYCLSTFEPSAA